MMGRGGGGGGQGVGEVGVRDAAGIMVNKGGPGVRKVG